MPRSKKLRTPEGTELARVGRCTITPIGLQFTSAEFSREDWEHAGRTVAQIGESVHWCIGDWLLAGEKRYGEIANVATDITGLDEKTLRNDKWVAKEFETSRRRDVLSWSHHREVASLPPKQQDKWLDKAESEGWSQRELRRQVRQKRITDQPPPPVREGTYSVLYADPPWSYGDERMDSVDGGGAGAHYPLMPVESICDLKVQQGSRSVPVSKLAAENSTLFLWVTSPLLPDGLSVMDAWGFVYKASFIWDKQRGFNGHYNDVKHELLLIGTKGSHVPHPESLPSSIVSVPKSKHSAKPPEFYDVIESLYPDAARLELFCRGAPRKGWEGWGNETLESVA